MESFADTVTASVTSKQAESCIPAQVDLIKLNFVDVLDLLRRIVNNQFAGVKRR